MTQPAYFLDTNILIYATSLADDHTAKRPVARCWTVRTDWGVSTQVLMEFYANARQPRHGLQPTAPQQFEVNLKGLLRRVHGKAMIERVKSEKKISNGDNFIFHLASKVQERL